MNKISSFEEQLSLHEKIIYTNVGDSMMPLLRENRDVLIIGRKSGPLKKYDIPLYKRNTGQYVLHRIVNVSNGEYTTLGDNRIVKERGVTDSSVIGVLVGVIRDGKEISFDSLSYKLYTRIWCGLYCVRFIVFKFRALVRILFAGGKSKKSDK